MATAYESFLERYESGKIPWNQELPPPEVIELVAGLRPGRGLDLGCGYGRSALYLAQKGWQADGVDFVAQAIHEASARAEQAGLSAQVQFHTGSVAAMPFLTESYDLAIDVGCMHSLTAEQQQGYRDELMRLLPEGAIYLLFAHLRAEDAAAGNAADEEDKPRGIMEREIKELFGPGFVLERVELGWTQVEDRPPWQSGWFWWRREE
ncbi:MAG: methyltransferase domain-containing protein [Ardenticatenaceae bacterium]|nr:methyltransferase domain-containing protein [Ardenticatenaceae bacterium]